MAIPYVLLLPVFAFHIPAGELQDTMKTWAKESDSSVMAGWEWDAADMGKTRTQAVEGVMTRQQAMQRLLRGTGLTFWVSPHNLKGNFYAIMVPPDCTPQLAVDAELPPCDHPLKPD